MHSGGQQQHQDDEVRGYAVLTYWLSNVPMALSAVYKVRGACMCTRAHAHAQAFRIFCVLTHTHHVAESWSSLPSALQSQ